MIQFVVTSVVRRGAPEVPTIEYFYPPDCEPVEQRHNGAVWEEISFEVKPEEKPSVQIGNIAGSAFLVGQPVKLVVNDPKFFGMFQEGDVVDFLPNRSVETQDSFIVVPKIERSVRHADT